MAGALEHSGRRLREFRERASALRGKAVRPMFTQRRLQSPRLWLLLSCGVLACDGSNISPVIPVVVPPTVAVVAVTPPTIAVAVGAITQLQATALAATGAAIPGASFAWSSSAPGVATVSSTGTVTGVAAGAAQITAGSGGIQGQATVTVTGGGPGPGGPPGNIVVNIGSPQQVMAGWEATAQAGQGTAAFPLYRDSLLTLAAGDLGIDRLRLAVRSGVENPVDFWTQFHNGQLSESAFKCPSYTVVNDDSDPLHINPAGFHFSELDSTVEQVVLPMQAKMNALGKRLYLNLNYTAFTGSCGNVAAVHQDPQEYAEFALAVFQHLQQKYGLVPDYWEMILEPDNGTPLNSGQLIGQALVATAARLAAAGFHPAFIAPSTEVAANASTYLAQMLTVQGVSALLTQLSYHRYGAAPSAATLTAIGQNGLQTAMLEHVGASYQELQDDLERARVSSWQQFTLAYPTSDNGAQYYTIDNSNPSRPLPKLGDRTRYLRQYFRYVRPGAVRVDASSTLGGTNPVAFVNADGRSVVVVSSTAAASLSVQGLPAGTYGARYTTTTATDVPLPDQAISAGQLVTGSIPSAGVITFYAK